MLQSGLFLILESVFGRIIWSRWDSCKLWRDLEENKLSDDSVTLESKLFFLLVERSTWLMAIYFILIFWLVASDFQREVEIMTGMDVWGIIGSLFFYARTVTPSICRLTQVLQQWGKRVRPASSICQGHYQGIGSGETPEELIACPLMQDISISGNHFIYFYLLERQRDRMKF